ncbi:MAG: hypothetical protein AAFN09_09025 [Pseudomonadota bacterium]
MNDQFREFRRRVGRIDSAYSRRVPEAFLVRSDGLVVPKVRSRLRFYFPFKALFAGFIAVMVVKGFLLYSLGEADYVARMQVMLEGSAYQELAAKVLMPDPVSIWAAARIGEFVALLPF